MRFDPAVHDSLGDELDGLAERVERLPDRVLLYTDDGEAAAVAAHERGLRPETVLVRRSTLEDVFLRLTGRATLRSGPARRPEFRWTDASLAIPQYCLNAASLEHQFSTSPVRTWRRSANEPITLICPVTRRQIKAIRLTIYVDQGKATAALPGAISFLLFSSRPACSLIKRSECENRVVSEATFRSRAALTKQTQMKHTTPRQGRQLPPACRIALRQDQAGSGAPADPHRQAIHYVPTTN